MAGKKQAQNLTPEQRLSQALVPEKEWPYPLPENWRWVRLLSVFENKTDSIKKIQKKDYLCEGSYPVIDQGQDFIGGFTNRTEMLFTGELPIIIFGDHTRCVKYVDFKFSQGADGVKVLVPHYFCNTKFFYYVLKNMEIPDMGYRRHYPLFNKFIVPLPPLSEQERIVNKIESLFTKLDEAKEKAEAVVDGFENRKAAILHQAFSGQLTEKWRQEHGVKKESWREDSLKALLLPLETKKPKGEKFRYIDIDSIDNKHQIVRSPKILSVNEAPSRASRGLRKGDILFSMVRPYLRNIALISEELSDCIASTGFYVCRPNDCLESKYLYYLVCSQSVINYLMQFMKGDNSPSIRKDNLLEMKMKYPSLPEQIEIVRLLDDFLAKEERAKELAENVIEQIELMKKSILARAFRGELGTNQPEEENAEEMLLKGWK